MIGISVLILLEMSPLKKMDAAKKKSVKIYRYIHVNYLVGSYTVLGSHNSKVIILIKVEGAARCLPFED